jgi:hypothetical protein
MARILSPACVYFLHARWYEPWFLHTVAIRISNAFLASSEVGSSPLAGVSASASACKCKT